MYKRVTVDGADDAVAVEEPLEIRVDGSPLAVTMRTPAGPDADAELALGFLWGEGLIDGPRKTDAGAELGANTVDVSGPLKRDPGARSFYTSSSCGVCGKGAIEEVTVDAPELGPGPELPRSLLASLPALMVQPVFEQTGGLHATGLFDRDGERLCVREDVGRHNALDKVVGWALAEGLLPLAEMILCVSGRLSFELVQKAVLAGCPFLVGVGAPSSLAIELAADRRLTLCGFARDGEINVYSCAERVAG